MSVVILPPSLTGRTDLEDVLDDVARARGSTMATRATILESLCRMAAELTAQHADPQRVLAWKDPPAADTERLLRELRERHVSRCG